MKFNILCSFLAMLTLSFAIGTLSAQSVSAQNTIAGTVYDKAGSPLVDIDVELLDEYYRLKGRQKTPSTGRYEFAGLNSGRYYVRVYAFRYDLMDETHEVMISSVSAIPGQIGSSYNLEDFYLQPRKGGMREAELSVVFTQDVPKPAEQAYKQALEDISKKRPDDGFVNLQKAIELFPEYYAALQKFGAELMARRQYLPAAQAFLKAAEVNPKSASPFYSAGYALYLLGDQYYKASSTALGEAVKLAPASPTVNLLLGTVERRLGRPAEAEKHLLAAKKNAPEKIPEVHKELAQLYGDQKRYREAADELEQYIKASKMSSEDENKARKVVASLRAKAQ